VVAEILWSRRIRNRQGAVSGTIVANTRRQTLAGALHVALTRGSNTIIGINVRALAQASMHAVESALHWDMHVLLVDLAISASILGVAHAGTIVAPSSISAIIGAGLEAAVQASKPRLAPARAIHAQAVVRAIADADRGLAVGASPLGRTNAGSIVALAVGQNASISAELHRAIKICPRVRAFAPSILASSVSSALIRARWNRAVDPSEPTTTQAGTSTAISVTSAVVLAALCRAISRCPQSVADARVVDTRTMTRASVGADLGRAVIG